MSPIGTIATIEAAMTGTLYPCMCVAPDAHSVHKVCIAAFDDHVAITLFGGEARCAFPKFNSRRCLDGAPLIPASAASAGS
jgi:hypothetical protein